MIPWLALLSSRAGVDLNAPLDRALSSTELGLSVAYKTSILLLASENQTVRELHGERIFSWLKRVKSEGDRDAALLLQYLYEPTDIVLEKLVSDSKNQYFDLGLSSQPAAFFANEQFFEVAFKAQRFDLLEQWHRFHVEAFPENSLEHAQKILSRGHMLISAIVSQNTVQSSRALSLVERLQKTSPEAFDHPVWREALGGLHIAEVPETLQLQFFETVPPMTGLVQLIDGINGGHIPFALREQVAEIIADRMPQDTLERGLLPNAAHLGLLKILYSQKHNALDGLLVRMSVTHGIDHEALLDVVVRNVHTEDHGPMFHELSQKVSSNEAASLVDSYRRTQYFEKVFEIFEGRLSSKAKSELFLIQYFDGIVRLKNNRWMKIASSPEVSRHLLEMLQVQSLSNTKFFELTDALERAGCLESSSSEQNFADLRASLKQARADRKKARLEAYSKKSDTSKKRKARDPQFESTETTLENKSSAGFQADMQKLESVAHVLREAVRDENLSGLDQAISGLDQVTATDLAEAKKEHRENLIKAVTAAVRVCAKEQHYVGAYKWAFEALKNKDTNELNAEVLAEWLAPIRAFFKKVRDVRPYLDGLAELQMHADGRVSAEMAELLHVYVQKDIDAAMQLSGPPIHMQKLHKLFEVSKDNADQKKLGAVYAAELLPYLSKVHADIADFARDAIEDQSKDLGEFLSARLAKRLKDYDGRIAKDAPPELSARSVAPESLWSGFTVGRGKDFSAKTSELFDRFFGSELVERADQDLRDALELAGMEAIFRREIEIGRVPIDMSQTHAGFDILSIDFAQGKIYCLEAKAKLVGSKHFDQITLTHHEMRVSKNISLSAQDSVFYQVEIIDVAPRGGKNGRVLDVYTLRRVELDPYDSNLIVPDSLADKNARYDRKKLIEAFGTEPFFWPSL
jgi:hypothetical protein